MPASVVIPGQGDSQWQGQERGGGIAGKDLGLKESSAGSGEGMRSSSCQQ